MPVARGSGGGAARVDLSEALLEVFSWIGAGQAFTSVTGEAR
ncbi:hypothetical protein OHQ35_33425 [Streptomyces anulatus]|nr:MULTISPECIES: hypothetical protein [Streptomyces]WUC90719.1 hypothetical protein OHQ35_33425 [Streptomyces anulatus]WUD93006.1 hypothetical protein OG703_34630 [Streptomyces anulatus]